MKAAAAGSVNYVADWVMDAVNDLIGRVDEDIVVETTIDPALQGAAERRSPKRWHRRARNSASAKARLSP